MKLREFREKLVGSDDLEVVIVADDHTYSVHDVEEGSTIQGTRELWIVTGDVDD